MVLDGVRLGFEAEGCHLLLRSMYTLAWDRKVRDASPIDMHGGDDVDISHVACPG